MMPAAEGLCSCHGRAIPEATTLVPWTVMAGAAPSTDTAPTGVIPDGDYRIVTREIWTTFPMLPSGKTSMMRIERALSTTAGVPLPETPHRYLAEIAEEVAVEGLPPGSPPFRFASTLELRVASDGTNFFPICSDRFLGPGFASILSGPATFTVSADTLTLIATVRTTDSASLGIARVVLSRMA